MRWLLVAFLLLATPADAASRVWISEFATARVEAAAPFAQLPAKVKQQLDFSTGVQTSQPFNKATRYIRVICEVQCSIAMDQTATTSMTLVPALRPEYFGVNAGSTLSVIAAP